MTINLPGCFHLLFLLSFLRKTKNAQLKNPTDLLHKNSMKPVTSLMGLGDTYILRRDLANQAWSIEILPIMSDKSYKINTQELKYYCWVVCNYAPCFYFGFFILWCNLASSRDVKTSCSHCLDNSKFERPVLFIGWNILLVMEWTKGKHFCHDSSFCEYREYHKHLPVSSVVFSSIGKKVSCKPIAWKCCSGYFLYYCFIQNRRTIFTNNLK